MLSKDTAAKRQAIRWVRETQAKVGAEVGMWWTDGSRSDDGRVGATAVCEPGDHWNIFRSHLATRQMEVYDAELSTIGLNIQESVKQWETLQTHGVTKVAVFSDLQVAM